MTDLAAPPTSTPQASSVHPLDRLTVAETQAAVEIVRADERFGSRARFASIDLHLPEKALVLAYTAGDAIVRAADVVVLDTSDGSTHEIVAVVERWDGGPMEPHRRCAAVDHGERVRRVRDGHDVNDPDFQAAMAKRVASRT